MPRSKEAAIRELRGYSEHVLNPGAGDDADAAGAYLRRRVDAIRRCEDLHRLMARLERAGGGHPALEQAADAANALASHLFRFREMEIARAASGRSHRTLESELLAAICRALSITLNPPGSGAGADPATPP